MSAIVDTLVARVTRQDTVIDSAIALIRGLSEQVREAAGDSSRLTQLADDIDAKTNELAAAVPANTPAEEPPAASVEADPDVGSV